MDVLDSAIQFAQKCLQSAPSIVLGSGASAAHGIRGMGPLKDHLLKSIEPADDAERNAWERFTEAIADTNDLEASLQRVQLPSRLIDQLRVQTRAVVIEDDLRVFSNLLTRQDLLPLSRLLRYLFRSTHRKLSIVTPNYDRLAEYAADQAGVHHETGFTHGYFRYFRNPNQTSGSNRLRRTVDIWKVHGSVDWFLDPENIPIAISYKEEFLDGFSPLLVTPGIAKYADTHREPFRSIITNADDALLNARAFLCIGYGFNDDHIEPKLVERVQRQRTPVVILTRTLSQAARSFLQNCDTTDYLAIERSKNASTIYMPNAADGVEVPDMSIWQLADFLDVTISEQ